MKPVKGMVLCTKKSQSLTNAVVVEVKEGFIEVLSDFGNTLKLTESELYEVSEAWAEHSLYCEHLGIEPYETLEDRVKSQIENLENVLNKLEGESK